jgi:D-beta-D-heptose 7-phosphate kinase/D-beta-D-heptose 1-phosphate adenosyltransferase
MSTFTRKGIFSPESSFANRFFDDLKKVEKLVENLKGLGLKIVLTQGTYDMAHVGHARYLEEARKRGDFLVVGVDSDEKVRSRKGPERPVVPQEERLEMLAHFRPVDIVVLKQLKAPKWSLIKTVRPDVLVATRQTYSKKQLRDLMQYCGEVCVLDPLATTTTSAKIRLLQIGTAQKLERALTPRIMETLKEVLSGVGEPPKKKKK